MWRNSQHVKLCNDITVITEVCRGIYRSNETGIEQIWDKLEQKENWSGGYLKIKLHINAGIYIKLYKNFKICVKFKHEMEDAWRTLNIE